jgi:hypothetical protein
MKMKRMVMDLVVMSIFAVVSLIKNDLSVGEVTRTGLGILEFGRERLPGSVKAFPIGAVLERRNRDHFTGVESGQRCAPRRLA